MAQFDDLVSQLKREFIRIADKLDEIHSTANVGRAAGLGIAVTAGALALFTGGASLLVAGAVAGGALYGVSFVIEMVFTKGELRVVEEKWSIFRVEYTSRIRLPPGVERHHLTSDKDKRAEQLLKSIESKLPILNILLLGFEIKSTAETAATMTNRRNYTAGEIIRMIVKDFDKIPNPGTIVDEYDLISELRPDPETKRRSQERREEDEREKRAEEKRKRDEDERKRKEDERKRAEEKRKREEDERKREEERKRKEYERKRAEEERKREENEKLRAEAEEEERKRREHFECEDCGARKIPDMLLLRLYGLWVSPKTRDVDVMLFILDSRTDKQHIEKVVAENDIQGCTFRSKVLQIPPGPAWDVKLKICLELGDAEKENWTITNATDSTVFDTDGFVLCSSPECASSRQHESTPLMKWILHPKIPGECPSRFTCSVVVSCVKEGALLDALQQERIPINLELEQIRNDNTPEYLPHLLVRSQYRYGDTNSLYVVPQTRIDLFKTSLAFSGATLWNSLPSQTKTTPTCDARNTYPTGEQLGGPNGPPSAMSPPPAFSTTWQTAQEFTSKGGQLKCPNSDVTLFIPENAVGEHKSVIVQAAMCTDLMKVHAALSLSADLIISSPVAEYFAGQDFKFETAVVIELPHFLPPNCPEDRIVLCMFRHESQGELKYEINEFQKCSNVSFAGPRRIQVKTSHFSGGCVCRTCGEEKVSDQLLMRLYGRCISPNTRDVEVMFYIWDCRMEIKDFEKDVLPDDFRGSLWRSKVFDPPQDPNPDVLVGIRLVLGETECQRWKFDSMSDAAERKFRMKELVLCTKAECTLKRGNSDRIPNPRQIIWILRYQQISEPTPRFTCCAEVYYVTNEGVLLEMPERERIPITLEFEQLHNPNRKAAAGAEGGRAMNVIVSPNTVNVRRVNEMAFDMTQTTLEMASESLHETERKTT